MIKKTGNKLLDEPRLREIKQSLIGERDYTNEIEKIRILEDLTDHYGIEALNQAGWMELCFKLIDDFVPASQIKKGPGKQKSDLAKQINIAACYSYCLRAGFKPDDTMDYIRKHGLMDIEISYEAIKKIKSRVLKNELFSSFLNITAKGEGIELEDVLIRYWANSINSVTNY